ncbi:hypothetical protein INR49_014783 [Caranx melampygus]|nr:hypothetical protein INR49_014783 [Caranx melampygus]
MKSIKKETNEAAQGTVQQAHSVPHAWVPAFNPALVTNVIKKTYQCMKEVMEQSTDKVLQNALANGGHGVNQGAVLSPLKAYLKSLRGILSNASLLFELECDDVGNLQTRSLNDIVRKEDLVFSEYLTTLLVVVARGSYRQWERTYESLSAFVVPRSSRKLYEDPEGAVFSVTLFKRAVCEFKAKAQESKFTVREYSFDLEERKQQEMKRLSVQKKEQYGVFVCWLKVNFSEVFIAWIHLKALRVFVESVLRYGLPVSYQALLLQTDSKHSKKLREELDSLFMHLDPTATASKTDVREQTHLHPASTATYFLSLHCRTRNIEDPLYLQPSGFFILLQMVDELTDK